MRILLFGLNEFGEESLKQLLKNKFNIVKVIIPNSNKKSSFINLIKNHKLNLYIYDKNIKVLEKQVLSFKPDLIIISSFTKILPDKIINYPKYGTINVHPSLLPKYRGAHPINWALIRDEKITGVTIHYVESTIDSGDILAQQSIPIKNTDDIRSLKISLAKIGANLLISIIRKIITHKTKLIGKKQNINQVTLAPKRNLNNSYINWFNNTRKIFNLIRASKDPSYYAFSYSQKREKISFYQNYISKKPGQVLAKIKDYFLISTGDGVIMVKTKKKLRIGSILS